MPGLNHTYGNRGGGWVHPGLEEAKRRADEAMAERRAAEEAARAAAEQLEGQGSLFDVEP